VIVATDTLPALPPFPGLKDVGALDSTTAEAVPMLARALEYDEPLARVHAAWALGRIGT
jgi:hypothetical protein